MEKPKLFQSIRAFKSMKDLGAAPAREFPVRREDYQLIEVVGRGVTATVWHAKCIPLDETVAIKILDMERMNVQMEEVMHEAQSTCIYRHPNVLSLHTAFVVGKDVWFVQPYVSAGSVFNIMRYKFPNGLDEVVIAIIMKEVAKALEYVHRSGGIHRDVKAGNILINTDGSVFLADFGVAATVERGGSWGNTVSKRNTFVGTPCWMAPEVMEQTAGYDSKADIWSFGITMLELAHGHAPFAKFPPIKVLLMTVQNPPPQLEAERGQRHFSKHMRDLVAQCLQKDPTKRPTASQLLESKFFRSLPDSKYLVSLVKNLPSLADRSKMLEEGKGGETSEDDAHSDIMRSKEGYVRGVSGWNFGDIMALKTAKHDAARARTPTIQENKGGEGSTKLSEERPLHGMTMPTMPTMSVMPVKPPEGSSKQESIGSPNSEISLNVMSPTKKISEHLHPLDVSHKGHEKNGKQSRFMVTTKGGKKSTFSHLGDSGALLDTPSHALVHAKDDTLFTSSELSDYEREHKPVIIGRFRVQDQVVKKDDAKNERDRKAASSSSAASTGSHFIPPATALSSHLQSFCSAQKHMCQSMEQMLDAIKEAERGNPATLQTLLSSFSPESHEALVHRVKELEVENKSLKERNAYLEQQLSHFSMSNGPMSSQERR